MEIVSSVAGKIADYLFDAAGRQVGYLLHYNDNIEALRKQAQKLADRRDRVQGKLDAAKRNRETIEADVENWITEVDNNLALAEKLSEDEVKANKKCLGGWSLNLRSRYRFSKEAQKIILEISQLKEEGKFEHVSRPAPPPGIISYSKGIFEAFESRKSIMKQIVEALNDENVSIIGICGMGGVGKTTLVEEIGKKAKEGKLYDAVLMVTVSQTPILTKIQEALASRLGLTLSGNDESTRASALWERIKMEQRILVILDDVWERIDLKKVGIPFGVDHKGCNILLTSRSQGVCNQMDVQKIFTLKTLTKEESWVLFREAAGQVVDNSDINPIAREVAVKCGGLPIAILTVGRALRDKDKNIWNDAAQQLKKSTPKSIEGMHKNVISSLELSYNYLEREEAKSLFLFCCLFPEDFNIQIELLVRHGMGLRWFKDADTVEEARVRTHATVSSLTSSFLLIVGDEEGFVKMHDIVRDVAITIASKPNNTFMVKAGVGLRVCPKLDSYEDLTAMSLMSNDIREIPDGLNFPKLQALLLPGNSQLVIPDEFFLGTKDLAVLDLSGIKFLSQLPPSLAFLANLKTLSLEDCILGDLSSIGCLTSLEILSLARSSIRDISINFGQLNHLRLLDLSRCLSLRLIQRGVISRLVNLEELDMWYSFKNWDFEYNAGVVELQALSRLTNLVIDFPNPSYLPNLKPFENLNRFTVMVGISLRQSHYLFAGPENYSRRMVLSHNMLFGPPLGWVKYLLKRSESLCLAEIVGLENIHGDLLNEEGLTELKFLHIRHCNILKYLLNTLERAQCPTFNNLEVLQLSNNRNFVEICHGQVPAESFCKLKELLVKRCDSILKIAPVYLLERLQNLECCFVDDCVSVVHIFDLQGVHEENKFLSSLQKLQLYNLPAMTAIWKGDFPSIILHSLAHIDIDNCGELVNLFTTSIAKSLLLLETLTVRRCSRMQEIVTDEEGEEGASVEKILFPNLYFISLEDLDALTCFCSGHYPMEFPALETLRIVKCPKMKTFGCGNQVTPKLNKANIEGKDQRMGNLNDAL
ncbi:Disease resistance protein [Melia azedarach]|uniref:Disease resistance protein n=1 Tax=Melia azedarach TaxID=155640 RepID=A0ACC1XFU8_MELAZ|nr:Disease resistance protein [Melia azedarach]